MPLRSSAVSDAVTLISQLTGVLLVATLLSSILSSVLYRPVRRLVSEFDPGTRATATLSFALITPGVALLAVLLNSGSTQWLVFEHCHGNECGTHAPLLTVGSLGNMSLVAGASLLLLGFATGIFKALFVGRRRLLTLFNLGNQQQDYVVIDSDHLLAWCCGLLRPKIVLSRALLQQFTADQISVVLAHEQAHVARLDNLRNLVARWSACLWLPAVRKQLCADLTADNEACCDAIALRTSPTSFQQVVAHMATQPQAAAAARYANFGTTNADARITAASSAGTRHPLLAHAMLTSVWILQAAFVSAAAHPVVEMIAAASL